MAERNLKKYAESGKSKTWNTKYGLKSDEIMELREMGENNMWAALIMAFNAGVEAGYRIGSKAKGGK